MAYYINEFIESKIVSLQVVKRIWTNILDLHTPEIKHASHQRSRFEESKSWPKNIVFGEWVGPKEKHGRIVSTSGQEKKKQVHCIFYFFRWKRKLPVSIPFKKEKVHVHQLCRRVQDGSISAANGGRPVNFKLTNTICLKNLNCGETMRFTIVFLGVLGPIPVLSQIMPCEVSCTGWALYIPLTDWSRPWGKVGAKAILTAHHRVWVVFLHLMLFPTQIRGSFQNVAVSNWLRVTIPGWSRERPTTCRYCTTKDRVSHFLALVSSDFSYRF